jgi:hypothetical protein
MSFINELRMDMALRRRRPVSVHLLEVLVEVDLVMSRRSSCFLLAGLLGDDLLAGAFFATTVLGSFGCHGMKTCSEQASMNGARR